MSAIRSWAPLIIALCAAASAWADGIVLSEAVGGPECIRVAMSMKLAGDMVVAQAGKPTTLKLAALAEHRYRERVLSANSGSIAKRAARYYDDARAAISVDGVNNPRMLRPERRLIVCDRQNESIVCHSPAGTLTREEVEIVGEHFDTLALPGVLSDKPVAVGDSWKLTDAVVQALCNFDSLSANELTASLSQIKDGVAVVAVAGTAKGAENGAQATVKVTATARYSLIARRITVVEWKQSDSRDQGPASPAVNAETIITIERSAVETPRELSDEALATVAVGKDAAEALKSLTIRDLKGRFEVVCSRDWQVTGRTESNLVLRLLDRGEFVAQATITPWQKAEPGQHMDAAAFRDAMLRSPGWTSEGLLTEGETPGRTGRWVYRVVARGQMENIAVLQTFYLVAGPNGDQVVVAITTKPAQADKLAGRDALLVDGLEFAK